MGQSLTKKVLVLIQGREVAASRYRILQYVPFLEEHGLDCRIETFPVRPAQYVRLWRRLPVFDSVFVQRKRFHFPFLPLFASRARRVVYDLDDAVMFKNSLAQSPYSRTRQRRFAAMVRASDAVIAGNSFLKQLSEPWCPQVELIPSSIPAERYRLKDYGRPKERVTIGWIGDHGSIHYLEGRRRVWEELGRRFPGQVELKIVCDVFFDAQHIPVRKVPWSEASEVEELRDMDIGVMPLRDDPWSQGKCGLKILQYCGVGIPAVCTPVGVNRDVVTPEVNGLWAMSDAQWVAALARLIEDPDLRERMGRAARTVLDQGYTREANAWRILKILTG